MMGLMWLRLLHEVSTSRGRSTHVVLVAPGWGCTIGVWGWSWRIQASRFRYQHHPVVVDDIVAGGSQGDWMVVQVAHPVQHSTLDWWHLTIMWHLNRVSRFHVKMQCRRSRRVGRNRGRLLGWGRRSATRLRGASSPTSPRITTIQTLWRRNRGWWHSRNAPWNILRGRTTAIHGGNHQGVAWLVLKGWGSCEVSCSTRGFPTHVGNNRRPGRCICIPCTTTT